MVATHDIINAIYSVMIATGGARSYAQLATHVGIHLNNRTIYRDRIAKALEIIRKLYGKGKIDWTVSSAASTGTNVRQEKRYHIIHRGEKICSPQVLYEVNNGVTLGEKRLYAQAGTILGSAQAVADSLDFPEDKELADERVRMLTMLRLQRESMEYQRKRKI